MQKAIDKLMKKRNKLLDDIRLVVDDDGMLAIKDMGTHAEKVTQIAAIHYAISVLGSA